VAFSPWYAARCFGVEKKFEAVRGSTIRAFPDRALKY
jgi:hypothetical protein